MSEHRSDSEYRASLEALRQATQTRPEDELRLKAILRNVAAEREGQSSRAASFWWKTALAGGLCAAAVLALVVLPPKAPIPPPASGPDLAQATLLLRSGKVALFDGAQRTQIETAPLKRGSRLVLEPAARVELSLGEVARAAVIGPAELELGSGVAAALKSGRASFSVARRAPNRPFEVQAGDSRVLVHGTQFTLQVERGKLLAAVVREGIVEVRGPLEESRLLRAGQSQGQLDAGVAELADDPTWRIEDGSNSKPHGFLTVGSEPEGALVEIDKTSVGRTPLWVQWPAGQHEVKVALEGHEAWQSQASLSAGATLALTASLVPDVGVSAEETDVPEAPGRGATGGPRLRRDSWKQAKMSLDTKRCERLERQVEALVRKSSRSEEKARALSMSAECWMRVGAKEKAMEPLRQIVDRYGATRYAETALFDWARLTAELGSREEALSGVERHLEQYPSSGLRPAAAFRRCELLLGLKRLAEAQECLEQYLAAYAAERRTGEAQLLLAALLRIEGKWGQAAKLYEAFLAGAGASPLAEKAAFGRIECLKAGRLEGLGRAVEEYLQKFPEGANSARVRSTGTSSQ